jgi:hypothetical protein
MYLFIKNGLCSVEFQQVPQPLSKFSYSTEHLCVWSHHFQAQCEQECKQTASNEWFYSQYIISASRVIRISSDKTDCHFLSLITVLQYMIHILFWTTGSSKYNFWCHVVTSNILPVSYHVVTSWTLKTLCNFFLPVLEIFLTGTINILLKSTLNHWKSYLKLFQPKTVKVIIYEIPCL